MLPRWHRKNLVSSPALPNKRMSIVQQIVQLYILQRAPKDVSYNPQALVWMFFIAIALFTLLAANDPIIGSPFGAAACSVIVSLAIDYAVLGIHDKSARFIQMSTASLGVSIVGAVIMSLAGLTEGLAAFVVVVQFWGFYLAISILRETLECSFLKATLITLASYMITAYIIIMLFVDMQVVQQIQMSQMQPSAS